MLSLKTLTTSTLYQIIARIASSGATFLITILVARHFGVSAYGDYAKVTAFVTMFYLLSDFGFNAMFLQLDQSLIHFHDLFYTRIFLSGVLIATIDGIAFFLPYSNTTNIGFSPLVRMSIVAFSLTILTESIVYSTFAIFQKKVIYEKYMLATIIGSVATFSIVGVFILLNFSLFWVFAGFVLGGIIESAFSIIFSEEKLLPMTLHINFVRELFYQTIPVALILFFNLVYFRIDTFLLSLFRASIDVGIYDISVKVFDFLIALPLFLSNALYPKLIEQEKNNQNVIRITLTYVFRFFIFGLIITVPFWFLSPLIFTLIKKELIPAVIPLRILLLSLPIFFATSILQWILLSKKQQKFLSLVYLFLTLLNITFNILFIPKFGYIASAIITDVGELIVLILLAIRIYSN